MTLFATPITYLQHLFSKFHYQLGSPGGGVNPETNTPPLDPPLAGNTRGTDRTLAFPCCFVVVTGDSLAGLHDNMAFSTVDSDNDHHRYDVLRITVAQSCQPQQQIQPASKANKESTKANKEPTKANKEPTKANKEPTKANKEPIKANELSTTKTNEKSK